MLPSGGGAISPPPVRVVPEKTTQRFEEVSRGRESSSFGVTDGQQSKCIRCRPTVFFALPLCIADMQLQECSGPACMQEQKWRFGLAQRGRVFHAVLMARIASLKVYDEGSMAFEIVPTNNLNFWLFWEASARSG